MCFDLKPILLCYGLLEIDVCNTNNDRSFKENMLQEYTWKKDNIDLQNNLFVL